MIATLYILSSFKLFDAAIRSSAARLRSLSPVSIRGGVLAFISQLVHNTSRADLTDLTAVHIHALAARRVSLHRLASVS